MAHVPPCSTRFQERVFDTDMRYAGRNLCRCCGRLMPGRRAPDASSRGIPDPLCARCADARSGEPK
jgi:hypothetical protein